MAYVGQCPHCGKTRCLDRHCGNYCFECLKTVPSLGHKPTCRVAIMAAKEHAINALSMHQQMEYQQEIIKQATDDIETFQRNVINNATSIVKAYQRRLRQAMPCPVCQGDELGCEACQHQGYQALTDELRQIANAPDPPIKFA